MSRPCLVIWSAISASLAASCAMTSNARYRGMLADTEPRPAAIALDDDVFLGDKVLDRAALVKAVLARNPDIEVARASWRRALARFPQETAIEDPVVSYGLAPLSIGSDAPFGQVIRIEQMLPTPGKRGLAGQVAMAESEAMRGDVDAARLRLALMASNLFDDFYVVDREIEINMHHRELIAQMKQSAEAQYAANRGSQQDALQADLELARLERERLGLDLERETIVSELNGLLHRTPTASIPPPPAELDAVPADAPVDPQAVALRDRPELRGLDAQIRRGVAAGRLARREAWPEIGVMAEYNSMWDMPEHRWMVGVSVQIPLQRGRRDAAVAEAEADTQRARAEYDRQADEIRVETEVAADRRVEANAVVALYDERLVPAARTRVDAALAGFVGDKNSFQVVLQAEHDLREVELERVRAQADAHRRAAELDRAVGRVPGIGGAP